MAESQKLSLSQRIKSHPEPWLLAAFSIFYFADVCLRASEKFFWYDELFTLYFARLPNIHSLWEALNSGVDFNPPLFYLVTRACNSLFGEGLVTTRIPEILGFWIFSLCLFRFVERRAGIFAGSAAMLFPMLTGAYFYAYEARPHALVLGACGLALICWQMAVETTPPRPRWLFAFAVALFFAFMMHCFALTLIVPFACVEIWLSSRSQKINWRNWFALGAPTLLALPLYVPLLQSYRKLAAGSTFSNRSPAGWTQISHFYFFLFEPCILVLLGIVIIFAFCGVFESKMRNIDVSETLPVAAGRRDLILGFAFVTLPVFGVGLGKLMSGPFFNRYFLSSLAGVSILIGLGVGLQASRKWFSLALTLLMTLGIAINFSRLITLRIHGRGEWLDEPSSQFALDTTPGKPLEMHPLLTAQRTPLPIAILNPLDFIYLVHYDPQLKAQLYFLVASKSNFDYGGFLRFLQCCRITFNPPVTYKPFMQAHSEYLVYGDQSDLDQIDFLGSLGAHVDSFAVNGGRFLARLSTKHK